MLLLEELTTSRVRARLLSLFYMHPEKAFHLKGLVRLLQENNNSLRRELTRLERLGLIYGVRREGRKEYQVNKANALYGDLRNLVLKTSGVVEVLRQALAATDLIELAVVYGSFARGSERGTSDVDLLLVGRADPVQVRGALRSAESLLNREINETLYDPEEFEQLRAEPDSFVSRILAGPTIWLVGEEHANR